MQGCAASWSSRPYDIDAIIRCKELCVTAPHGKTVFYFFKACPQFERNITPDCLIDFHIFKVALRCMFPPVFDKLLRQFLCERLDAEPGRTMLVASM